MFILMFLYSVDKIVLIIIKMDHRQVSILLYLQRLLLCKMCMHIVNEVILAFPYKLLPDFSI